MPVTIEASTQFYTVATVAVKKGNLGQNPSPQITVDERLIMRRGGNGMYAIRPHRMDTIVDGPGGDNHPFNMVALFVDWLRNYPDYSLTEDQAKAELSQFEVRNADKGSNFSL